MNKTDKLEKRIIELLPEAEVRYRVADLYANGYEPKHNTMRKRIGDYEAVFRETHNGVFEFAALMRITGGKPNMPYSDAIATKVMI